MMYKDTSGVPVVALCRDEGRFEMKFMKEIKKILSDACVYFTASEFVLLAVAAAFGQTSPEKGGTVGRFLSLGAAGMIFAACLMMSALNLVFRLGLSGTLKVLIHFTGSLIAFSLVFIVIPKAYADFGAIFVRLGIFAVLYAVIAVIVLIVRGIAANRRSDDLEYESQFGEFFSSRNVKH